MDTLSRTCDRRLVLRRLGAWCTTLAAAPLLAGCGGGGGGAADTTTAAAGDVPATPPAPAASAPIVSSDAQRLNLALNIAYLGAHYHSIASGGAGVPPDMAVGVGRQGTGVGARAATFSDETVAATAAEMAADKLADISILRARLGASAAAMPALDLSAEAGGAFTTVAQAAQLVSGASFDAYAADDNYLLGAFMVEDSVAAALRGLSREASDPATSDTLDAAAASATYHAALVRTMLDRRTPDNPGLADSVTRLRAAMSRIDGSDGVDLANADGQDLTDAAGRAVPFVRLPAQALRAIFLGTGPGGGFLPGGANGLA